MFLPLMQFVLLYYAMVRPCLVTLLVVNTISLCWGTFWIWSRSLNKIENQTQHSRQSQRLVVSGVMPEKIKS
jgi:hypothetical protein